MQTLNYSVPAIHCHNCVNTIKMEVGELSGVQSVEATVDTKSVVIEFDEPATEEQIQSLLTEINYAPALA